MEVTIFGALLAFLITFFVIPVIILIADKKKLYDVPDDTRKFHSCPIPSLGGLGMFVGFILSVLLTINFTAHNGEFQYYTAAFLLIFFIGIKDDILVLSPLKKFTGQLLATAILVFKAKLILTNMHGLAGFYLIHPVLSYLLSIFSIIVIINAFNLIDGVDGLAGSLGFVSSFSFGLFFLFNQNFPYAILAFAFAGSLAAFLVYNFHPAKIFMGDTGSLMIGLVNSILVIKFIETGSSSSAFPIAAAPAIGFSILLIPLMDTLRVFSLRIIRGHSPFRPDRNHIHHLLLNKGFNHRNITFFCVITTILISGFTVLFQHIPIGFLISAQIAIFFSVIYILKYKKPAYGLRVVKSENKAGVTKNKVRYVNLYDKKAVLANKE